MLTKSFADTFLKLALHVRKHFGIEIRFVDLSDLAEHAGDGLSQLETGSSLERDDKIYLPLLKGRNMIGATEISRADLDFVDRKRLSETIQLLLESKMEGLDQIDFLREVENATCNNERKSNVIMMNEFRGGEFELRELSKIDRTRLNFPFVVEGSKQEDLHKMAFEIHYRSGRYAFFSIGDLDRDTLTKVEEIHKLGAVTVFIPEFKELDREIQEAVLKFMNSLRTKDSPQFIAGTTIVVPQLRSDPAVSTELVDTLMVGYICMSEPFDVYKSGDWVEFFADSLQTRPQLDV